MLKQCFLRTVVSVLICLFLVGCATTLPPPPAEALRRQLGVGVSLQCGREPIVTLGCPSMLTQLRDHGSAAALATLVPLQAFGPNLESLPIGAFAFVGYGGLSALLMPAQQELSAAEAILRLYSDPRQLSDTFVACFSTNVHARLGRAIDAVHSLGTNLSQNASLRISLKEVYLKGVNYHWMPGSLPDRALVIVAEVSCSDGDGKNYKMEMMWESRNRLKNFLEWSERDVFGVSALEGFNELSDAMIDEIYFIWASGDSSGELGVTRARINL